MKRVLSALLVLALAAPAALTAQTTLKVMIPGSRPAGMDLVLAEAQKRMAADGLNLVLDVNFIPWSDLGQKTQIVLASGENVDLIFDAPWLHLPQMVAKGFYEPLDALLAKDGPNILKAIPKVLLDANRIGGQIMGLPLTNAYLSGRTFWVRKDIREKLGVKPIKSWDELVKFAYAVKTKVPGTIPFQSIGGNQSYDWTIPLVHMDTKYKIDSLQGFVPFTLYTKNNDGKIYNLFDTKDPYLYGLFKQGRQFYKDKIFDPDILSITDGTAAMESGKYAIVAMTDFGVSPQIQTNLSRNVPGAEYEMVTFWSTRPGDYVSAFKAWNFIAVPKVSKNKDAAVSFLNWVMSSQDNYDLLAYGLKGTHWEPMGGDSYKTIGSDYTYFPYAWIWNTTYDRITANTPEEKSLNKFLRVASNFTVDKLTGFTWDPTPVSNEVSKFSASQTKYWPLLVQGVADTDNTFDAFKKEAGDAAKKIQAEYQRQVDAFLAAKGK
jgi:putative aldouronate transport system substrate-binding protein